MSIEQRIALSKRMCTETQELVDKIKSMHQSHSIKQICDELLVDDATLWRIINHHNIKLTANGRKRARRASATATVGREPWNKGKQLDDDTKKKIGASVRGQLNGQYGRGMTEEEKVK